MEMTVAVQHRAVLNRQTTETGTVDLRGQPRPFHSHGSVSQENRAYGFRPAFRDSRTGVVYLSRFADGRLAPMHLLNGLPPEVVLTDPISRQVVALKDSVTAGFVRESRFYSRQEAAAQVVFSLGQWD